MIALYISYFLSIFPCSSSHFRMVVGWCTRVYAFSCRYHRSCYTPNTPTTEKILHQLKCYKYVNQSINLSLSLYCTSLFNVSRLYQAFKSKFMKALTVWTTTETFYLFIFKFKTFIQINRVKLYFNSLSFHRTDDNLEISLQSEDTTLQGRDSLSGRDQTETLLATARSFHQSQSLANY